MTKSRNILAPKKFWTTTEIARLRELYPDTKAEELVAVFGRPLKSLYCAAKNYGIQKSAAYLASPAACRLRREHTAAGIATRFKPGQVPFNKGLRRPGWAPGRMAETQFRKGERRGKAAENWVPVGTILTDTEGYQRIKVRDAVKGEATGFGNVKVWPLLNRHVWEQHHGPIPADHAVVFKDGDRANVGIGNLECISRQDLMRRNSSQRWGKEVFEVIQLRGALNRKLNRKMRSLGEKQDIGSTQPSVRDAGSVAGRNQAHGYCAGEGGQRRRADHHQLRQGGDRVSGGDGRD